jgi:hypothetical protein
MHHACITAGDERSEQTPLAGQMVAQMQLGLQLLKVSWSLARD